MRGGRGGRRGRGRGLRRVHVGAACAALLLPPGRTPAAAAAAGGWRMQHTALQTGWRGGGTRPRAAAAAAAAGVGSARAVKNDAPKPRAVASANPAAPRLARAHTRTRPRLAIAIAIAACRLQACRKRVARPRASGAAPDVRRHPRQRGRPAGRSGGARRRAAAGQFILCPSHLRSQPSTTRPGRAHAAQAGPPLDPAAGPQWASSATSCRIPMRSYRWWVGCGGAGGRGVGGRRVGAPPARPRPAP